MNIDDLNYEELRAMLEQLPQTWYPDLIRALVEASYKKGVWKPNGCSLFVQQTEAKLIADNESMLAANSSIYEVKPREYK